MNDEDERMPDVAPEDQAYIAGYNAGFEAGHRAGVRDGYRAGRTPPKPFGPIRGSGARELFPLATTEPDRFVTLLALSRVYHQANRRNGAPLGEPVE